MSDREAMQQALDALLSDEQYVREGKAISLLKQALARQPVVTRPVAWLAKGYEGGHEVLEIAYKTDPGAFPVYWLPPSKVEQINQELLDALRGLMAKGIINFSYIRDDYPNPAQAAALKMAYIAIAKAEDKF